jgi:hypothetical protein
MKLVTLRCPAGAEQANVSHGAFGYRPYMADPRDPQTIWLVDVAPEAVTSLCHNAGFQIVPDHPG